MHTLGERSARPRARPPSCLQPWLPLAANPRSPMCGSPPPEGERERKEGEQRGGGRVKRESMRLIGAAYGNGGIRYGAGGELTRLIRNGSLDEFSGALLRVSCRVSVFALLHTDTHATHTHTHTNTLTHTHTTHHAHTYAGGRGQPWQHTCCTRRATPAAFTGRSCARCRGTYHCLFSKTWPSSKRARGETTPSTSGLLIPRACPGFAPAASGTRSRIHCASTRLGWVMRRDTLASCMASSRGHARAPSPIVDPVVSLLPPACSHPSFPSAEWRPQSSGGNRAGTARHIRLNVSGPLAAAPRPLSWCRRRSRRLALVSMCLYVSLCVSMCGCDRRVERKRAYVPSARVLCVVSLLDPRFDAAMRERP
jgi:hypothetical protein